MPGGSSSRRRRARTSDARVLFGQHAALGEVGEQEVEVDEPGERVPGAHSGLNAGVVERPAAVEPAREVVAGAYVVPREDMQPPEPAQQGVLGRPATDPA